MPLAHVPVTHLSSASTQASPLYFLVSSVNKMPLSTICAIRTTDTGVSNFCVLEHLDTTLIWGAVLL